MLFVQVYQSPTDWDTLDLSTQLGGVTPGTHFSDVARRRGPTASAPCCLPGLDRILSRRRWRIEREL